jgi:hypothetical protein
MDEEWKAEDRWVRIKGMADKDRLGAYCIAAAINGYYRLTWYWGVNILSWRMLSRFQFVGTLGTQSIVAEHQMHWPCCNTPANARHQVYLYMCVQHS